ncbi:MAG: IS1634 family transposase [Deltaproteobacteria bacterium]|jgi:transposase|nr:MAG: IS1634 family transposase [Deltaproteobacteria bacterium]
MYIRQTTTSSKASGEAYTTFRLVSSERVGGKVKQRTILNLGTYFDLPKDKWPHLCTRIEQILSGQRPLFVAEDDVERAAQRYTALLISKDGNTSEPGQDKNIVDYQEVDICSLELLQPRPVGVEHVGLAALEDLHLPQILAEVGLNTVQQHAAIGSIIGRMAQPGSELATHGWLTERSGLGELLGVELAGMPLIRLYRTSDLLVKHRKTIEALLFARISKLFSLETTVTLYDLTNTYFEGEAAGNGKARRGHSKEKRSDCPLVTLGLVLDGSGFVRRSQMFAGNVGEAATLEGMLAGLQAPAEALVIMDRGIATESNIDWLVDHHYRYLVVSRQRSRQFDETQAVEVVTRSEQSVLVQRVLNEEGTEAKLYCYSPERHEKESGIANRFMEKFEGGLAKLARGLASPRGEKRRDKICERIGRLQEKSRGISQHYRINITPDTTGTKVVTLTWEKIPVPGTMLTHPGVYCLRTNELSWDENTLWRTYTMLTDLEAVFRSLKSELGLRPIYHHKEVRAEGHLFITVLAYQAIQVLRRRLRQGGFTESWKTLKRIFAGQQRVTATFKQKDGRTLHVRKTTTAEPKLKQLYDVLGLSASPGTVKKLVV